MPENTTFVIGAGMGSHFTCTELVIVTAIMILVRWISKTFNDLWL
jgi:hypothetical protein